ncbi:uncharacterized protein LOC124921453 [Impatiens glandulifera]|uniref:uncharacterized protein LOC124921453 n=1 Tax=Impatiens glandulifera TaxID=253017 RepID=UPI001FB092D4|nr:uncharacterized protein LOC124921453 [Impatiens glandulifera]
MCKAQSFLCKARPHVYLILNILHGVFRILISKERGKMGERGHDHSGWPPSGSPLYTGRDDHWSHFDTSVNAVSFGFVATAVLISMFLVMAIFERFLINMPPSPPLPPSSSATGRRFTVDVESQMQLNGMFIHLPSPKILSNARELSVLMPGEHIPRFIAQPSPMPYPPDPNIAWPANLSNPLQKQGKTYHSINTGGSSSA